MNCNKNLLTDGMPKSMLSHDKDIIELVYNIFILLL
jgi:hypothetical protein